MTEDAAEATDENTGSEPVSDPSPEDVSELAARVAAYDEQLGESVATTGDQLASVMTERDDLAEEIEDLTDRIQRVQADFQNYKKRAERQQEEMKQRATENLVERLLEVRDNLERALDQDEDTEVREGVEATLREFDRVLESENVDRIDPAEGEAVDPRRHEVLHRESQDADAITSVYRPGYEMGDKVLRPAQVTVGTQSDKGESSPETDETSEEMTTPDGDDTPDNATAEKD